LYPKLYTGISGDSVDDNLTFIDHFKHNKKQGLVLTIDDIIEGTNLFEDCYVLLAYRPTSYCQYIQTMGRSQRKDATQKAKGGLILDADDLTIDGKTIYRNLHGRYLVELQEKKM